MNKSLKIEEEYFAIYLKMKFLGTRYAPDPVTDLLGVVYMEKVCRVSLKLHFEGF